jgi:hypothetical protein
VNTSDQISLPIERWSDDMRDAVAAICEIGERLLRTNQQASEKAAHIATQWRLAEKLGDERASLENVFATLRRILSSINATRQLMNKAKLDSSELRQAMVACADLVDASLPGLQNEFLVIRHCALDVLRWVKRFGKGNGIELASEYRSSYARLLDYTPIFRPFLEGFQKDLLKQTNSENVPTEVQRLLGSLNHYMAATDSAKAFLNSVVSPNLDLVFHETDAFVEDWQSLDIAIRGQLATELNDHCQLLLYDQAGFEDSVENIHRPLAEGVDASLYVFSVEGWRIIFAMDEDPVFQQLVVTLLRVVTADLLDPAIDDLVQVLYQDFSND